MLLLGLEHPPPPPPPAGILWLENVVIRSSKEIAYHLQSVRVVFLSAQIIQNGVILKNDFF